MSHYGGAPPWVYKQQQAALSASYDTQIHQLNQRIKSLEEENGRLKKQLEEANRKNEELARRLSEKAA
jgi:predicted RNase H-like nuclease (RuvC/YqgF family)